MFGRHVIVDPSLGELQRRRGGGDAPWRGRVELHPGLTVALALPGARHGPDPEALHLGRQAAALYRASAAAIAAALDEHAEPYGGRGPQPPPQPSFVRVCSLDGTAMVEFGYRVPWDDDHVLAARVHDGRLVELCGSVLEP